MNHIKTDADYQTALNRIDEIFEAPPGTPLGDECDELVHQVEEYEDKLYGLGGV